MTTLREVDTMSTIASVIRQAKEVVAAAKKPAARGVAIAELGSRLAAMDAACIDAVIAQMLADGKFRPR